MKILVIGSEGMIGKMVTEALVGHDVTKADITLGSDSHGKSMFLDVTDAGAVREAVGECDTVIHLAIHNVSPRSNEELSYAKGAVSTDIPGITNVLQAAARHPKKHVIYASSVTAFDGYPTDYIRQVTDPPLADSTYGLTKVYGEAACQHAFFGRGVPVSIMRIGRPIRPRDLSSRRNTYGTHMPFLVHPIDVQQAFARAVECVPETVGSGYCRRNQEKELYPNVYHVVGDSIGLQFDLEATWSKCKWRPMFGFFGGVPKLRRFHDMDYDVPGGPAWILYACRRGWLDEVKRAMEANPDWDRDAVLWAAASNHDHIVKYLCEVSPPTEEQARGMLKWHVVHSNVEMVRYTQAYHPGIPLKWLLDNAVHTRSIEMARCLCDLGVDVNHASWKDTLGNYGDVEMAEMFLRRGKKVSAAENDIALERARLKGFTEAEEFILQLDK